MGDKDNPLIEPLEREKRLYERVADQIRDLIRDDKWKPGDRLPTERELSAAFKVSRTVIREAVKYLEAQGILEVTTGSGIYVHRANPDVVYKSFQTYIQLQDSDDINLKLVEVRSILEIEVAALAALRSTPEQHAALHQIVEQMHASVGSAHKLAELDFQFHALLAKTTLNELFGMILKPFMEQIQYIHRFGWEGYKDNPEFIIGQHEDVLVAVEQGNSDKARQAMAVHMETANGLLLKLLEEQANT